MALQGKLKGKSPIRGNEMFVFLIVEPRIYCEKFIEIGQLAVGHGNHFFSESALVELIIAVAAISGKEVGHEIRGHQSLAGV